MDDTLLRVIHTIASLRADHGGPSRTVAALCSGLPSAELDVELITHARSSKEAPPVLPDHESVCVHLVARQSQFSGFFPAMSRFVRVIQKSLADGTDTIVHDHGIWLPTNHAVVRYASRNGWPTVVSPRGMLSSWALSYHRWKKRPAWMLYQKRDLETVTLFHAASAAEAECVRALGFKQPIALIPNGVDVPVDDGRNAPQRAQRRALFLSRIHPSKGLLNLVAAWAQVRPEGWQLMVVGPDENGHRREVESAVRASGIANNVVFSGAVDDKEKWAVYSQADLFVLPTFSENFGVVVAEALGIGLPVITTKAAPWQQLETYGCGWWIEVGVEPLAKALKEATELPDEIRLAAGRKGQALVKRRYTWPAVAEEMRSVYEWMLGGGTPPACIIME